MDQHEGPSVLVVQEEHGVSGVGFLNRLAVIPQVAVGNTVHDLLPPGAVHIVVIGMGSSVGIGSGCQSAAIAPREGPVRAVVVRQRVARAVIGDGVAIIRNQKILPVPGAVSVGMGYGICAIILWFYPDREDIAYIIIGIIVVRIPTICAGKQLPLGIIGVRFGESAAANIIASSFGWVLLCSWGECPSGTLFFRRENSLYLLAHERSKNVAHTLEIHEMFTSAEY